MTTIFSIETPRTIDEALGLMSASDETIRPIAGGTGLGLLMKHGFYQPTLLVNLRDLASEMTGVRLTPDGALHLGAMTTLRDLEIEPQISRRVPLLRQALTSLATVRLRNVACLGGAIAHGDPQMDLPPALLALDAKVLVRSRRGDRWIGAADVFVGPYKTAVENDELILEVLIPPMPEHRGTYRKCTVRTVDDWPIVGIAAVALIENGQPGELRVAVGAPMDHAQRLAFVETTLSRFTGTVKEIQEVAETAADSLQYSDRPMASAGYQRQLVAVHLRRVLETLLLGSERQIAASNN